MCSGTRLRAKENAPINMTIRDTFIALAALLLAPLAALHAADAPPVPRPNILFITAEDICPNLGCYSDPNAVTPNLDRFAKEGIRFTSLAQQTQY